MVLRIVYICIIVCLMPGAFSCGKWRGPKEYIERDGLHSDQKPHEMASEIGAQSKSQQREYRRQLAKQWKKKHPGEKRRQNPYR